MGSEMCIRDRWYYFKTGFGKKKDDAANGKNSKKAVEKKKTAKAQ